jgi:hypothetical protein
MVGRKSYIIWSLSLYPSETGKGKIKSACPKRIGDSGYARVCLTCFLLGIVMHKRMLYRHYFSTFAVEYAIKTV